MPAENLWRVDIVNAPSDETNEKGGKAVWHSINSQVTYYPNMSKENKIDPTNYIKRHDSSIVMFHCRISRYDWFMSIVTKR